MQLSLEMILKRPAADVWRAFDDPVNLKVWQPSLVAYEPLSGPPGEIGSTARLTFHERGFTVAVVQTVTLRRPPHEFAAIFDHAQGRGMMAHQFFDLADGSTRWVAGITVQLKGMLRLLAGAFRGQAERRIHEDAARFRAALEAGLFDRSGAAGAAS